MDSTQEIVASSGALQNITSYLNGTLANLSSVLQDSSEYISQTLGIPPSVVYSSLAVLVAIPVTMSRYGWSRDQISPYTPVPSGVPAVTDEDFSYITSQDLDEVQYHPRSHSLNPVPDDDVLLIKNRGVTYPTHFPAYAIGDGKLRVKDVRERVAVMMELPEKGARRIKLLYKGRQLKEPLAAVRDYGVKNNSEVMAVIPEIDDASSPSEEEMVIVDAPRKESKSKRGKKKKGKKRADGGEGSSVAASSPRDSASTFDAPRSPPPPHLVPSGATSGPLKQLDELCSEFITKWLPLCDSYMANPPTDPKRRKEDHLKLSESILLHIVLKLDGVESDGVAEVRLRRKGLIQQVQDTLKKMDAVRDS